MASAYIPGLRLAREFCAAVVFTAALRETITDQRIRRLPPKGAVDQFIDSTDALGHLPFLRVAFRLFSGDVANGVRVRVWK